ncbi:hypothetical protein N7533_008986 [Penicillium manginii]|uniref:uncharacterized protein n=1 Tax=Penicillium manginii TaxID=203109 RepID=UPI002547B3B5|nr:uncharacterized protein N7533_008986 [Penicillium manginii]KAJ5744116.1 hypothetical protein N7533_008986 [Penicillium manginii]
MMRPQLRQLARHTEAVRTGLSASVRPFSVSCAAREGESKPSAPAKPERRQNAPTAQRRPPQSRGPPGAPNRRPANLKAIDARSFAAPAAGSDQPRIIRSPRARNVRPGGQGNQGQGQFQGRKPFNKKPLAKAKGKGGRERRPRDAKRDDGDEAQEAAEEAAIEKIEQEQALKERPVPVRYEPRDIDFSTLKATWPSLPSDANSRSAAVLEKVASLGGRFANGYIPPYELARRMWKGENVLFESEAERIQTLEEVKRLSQLRADKISQRKGELVEPKEVKFNALNAEGTKTLMDKYALGKYPVLEAAGKDEPAALGDVVRNLRNNGTYETAGKRPQFMAKVESLLSSRSSRVKRA